jgi:hypothetical protein
MRRLLTRLALLTLVSCLPAPVSAQVAQFQATVVPTCGSVAGLPVNQPHSPYMDVNGNLCTAAASAAASSSPGSREQDVRATQTLSLSTLNAAITVPLNGQGTVGFTFTGLTGTGAVLTYEQSNDGGTWTGINEVNAGTGVFSGTRSTDGQVRVSVSGRASVRVRVSTVGTGTATVATNASVREGIVTLGSPLPPGTNALGTVALNAPLPAGTNTVGNIGNAFNLEATQQGVATSNAAIATATGTQADAASASGASTSVIGALRAIRDRLLGTVNTAVIGNDAGTNRQIRVTTTGVLEPPTAAAGKIVETPVTLVASTSTQLVAANANRIAMEIQCDGAAPVAIGRTGATLTGLATGLVIPSGSYPLYTPPVPSLTAITAWTATGQTCRTTEYIR